MIQEIDSIDTLLDQITAILELMRAANIDVEIESMNVAADMCMTMCDEVAIHLSRIEQERKKEQDRKKEEQKNEK